MYIKSHPFALGCFDHCIFNRKLFLCSQGNVVKIQEGAITGAPGSSLCLRLLADQVGGVSDLQDRQRVRDSDCCHSQGISINSGTAEQSLNLVLWIKV